MNVNYLGLFVGNAAHPRKRTDDGIATELTARLFKMQVHFDFKPTDNSAFGSTCFKNSLSTFFLYQFSFCDIHSKFYTVVQRLSSTQSITTTTQEANSQLETGRVGLSTTVRLLADAVNLSISHDSREFLGRRG